MSLSAQISSNDSSTLISVKEFVAKLKPYIYLEIGSYLGGSLHWHLHESRCLQAISVDQRSTNKIKDERVIDYAYTVTTQDMLNALKANNVPTDKLNCIDGTVDDVSTEINADLVFIDGEHTNEASYHDATRCLMLTNKSCILLFHDDWIVYQGIEKFAEYLESTGKKFIRCKFTNCDVTAFALGDFIEPFQKFAEHKASEWSSFARSAQARLDREITRNRGKNEII